MKWSFFIGFVLLFSLLSAQISFEAVCNQTVIRVGENTQIQYIITAKDFTEDMPSISFPNFSGFKIMGSSKGRNMNIINGDVQKQYVENIVLQPLKSGNYTIQPAEVKVNGKSIFTDAININVLDIQDKDRNPGIVFLQLSLSSKEVYPQQPVIASLKLYAKTFDALRRRSDVVVPKLNDFQVQKIKSVIDDRSYSQEYVGENQYISEEVARFTLYPNKTGKLNIPTFELRVAIPVNFFDERIILVKSNEEQLLVKNFPKNAPSDFTGSIGEFTLRSYVDNINLEVGEPTKLHIIVEGEGNFSALEFPTLPEVENLEVYPPKIINKAVQKDAVEKGSVEQTYVVIPMKGGNFTIPNIQLSFFNPSTNQYESCSTDAIKIQVKQEEEDIQLVQKDSIVLDSINPIDPDKIWDGFKFKREISFGNKVFPFWQWFTPFFLLSILLLFFVRSLFKKKPSNKQEVRVNKVTKKDIQADIKSLENVSKLGNIRDYTEQSSRLLQDVIQYIGEEDKIYYSLSEGKEILNKHRTESLAQLWEKLYNDTQMLSYGGTSSTEDLNQNLKRHKDLVKAVLI